MTATPHSGEGGEPPRRTFGEGIDERAAPPPDPVAECTASGGGGDTTPDDPGSLDEHPLDDDDEHLEISIEEVVERVIERILSDDEGGGLEGDVDGDPGEVALEHVTRYWNAEEENARRLAQRSRGVLTLIGAFFGIAFVKIGSLPKVEPLWLGVTFNGTLALSLLFAAAAVGRLLSVRWASKRDRVESPPLGDGDEPGEVGDDGGGSERREGMRVSASTELAWPTEHSNPYASLPTAGHARAVAFTKTWAAAAALQEANAEHQGRVDDGQIYALCGGALAILATVVYLVISPFGCFATSAVTKGGSCESPRGADVSPREAPLPTETTPTGTAESSENNGHQVHEPVQDQGDLVPEDRVPLEGEDPEGPPERDRELHRGGFKDGEEAPGQG